MKKLFFAKFFKRPIVSLAMIGLLSTLLLLTAVQSKAESRQEITVSAAASLKNVFEDLGKLFESQKKGVKVYFNFASSGELLKQIVGGAPVDVFASAAQREMDDLESKNLLVPGTRHPFAGNEIVLAQPAKTTVKMNRFEDLKKAEIKLIGIGNPASVPAGLYASETLQYMKVWDDVKGRLVFGESVRQVLDYISRGEVDAGMVFATDARTRPNDVRIIASAPAGSHRAIVYPIAVVKGSKQEALAFEFTNFVRSEPGRKVLEKYGFKRLN